MGRLTGGIGVRIQNGRVFIETINRNKEVIHEFETSSRGLFMLSDLLGSIACKLTGLSTNAEIDAFLNDKTGLDGTIMASFERPHEPDGRRAETEAAPGYVMVPLISQN
jgi:hypothetical protein